MIKQCHVRLILLLVLSIFPSTLAAQRSIPDNNLSYPVLIQLTNCVNNIPGVQASGFYLKASNGGMYLITARHVLYNQSQPIQPGMVPQLLCKNADLLSYGPDPTDRSPTHLTLDLQAMSDGGRAKAHSSHDVAAVKIGVDVVAGNDSTGVNLNTTSHVFNPGPGVSIVQRSPSGMLSLEIAGVKKLNEVLTANDVYILGYPGSIGIHQVPQIDYSKPLLRKGIVAGINDANGTIVLDALVFQGNSGGPVLQVEHNASINSFSVIGVISQFVPIAETWQNTTLSYSNVQIYNSGYSIIEPMDAVLELIGK